MIEVPEIKVQISAAKPKFTAARFLPGIWKVTDGDDDVAYFSGPNAEQYAREHADRLNAEASAIEPGIRVRNLPLMTLFRVASHDIILIRVECGECRCMTYDGRGDPCFSVTGGTPVTAILGRLVLTEGE